MNVRTAQVPYRPKIKFARIRLTHYFGLGMKANQTETATTQQQQQREITQITTKLSSKQITKGYRASTNQPSYVFHIYMSAQPVSAVPKCFQ